MKAFKAVPLIAVLALLALAPDVSADAYYRMLFERAVFLLETRIEPINAVPIFQEIIRRHGDDRSYAALCQLYIGLCYRKSGSGDLAAQAFREVIRDYPEQAAVARIAEAGLGDRRPRRPIRGGAGPVGRRSPDWSGATAKGRGSKASPATDAMRPSWTWTRAVLWPMTG
jgi:hypothetical protein